jgi:hypothetical protein
LPEGFLFGKTLHAVAQIKVFIRTNAEAALADSVGASRTLSQPRLLRTRPQEYLLVSQAFFYCTYKMSKFHNKVIDTHSQFMQ